MKSFLTVAALCSILILGPAACRNAEKKMTATVPPTAAPAPKQDHAQTPYYYGLIEEYRGVVAADPHNLAALIGLGNAYSDSGSWREAIRYYESALKIDPHNADVRTDMGTAFRNLGLPHRALDEYRQALKDEPAHLNARFHMGIVYAFDLRDYAVAMHIWEELMQLSPNYPQAPYMRNCIVTFKKVLARGQG